MMKINEISLQALTVLTSVQNIINKILIIYFIDGLDQKNNKRGLL